LSKIGHTEFNDSFLMESTDEERQQLWDLQFQTGKILYGILQRTEPEKIILLKMERPEENERTIRTSYVIEKKEAFAE